MDGLYRILTIQDFNQFPTKKCNFFSRKPGRVPHERGENVPGGQRHQHPPVQDVLEGLEGLLQLDRHQVGQEGGPDVGKVGSCGFFFAYILIFVNDFKQVLY